MGEHGLSRRTWLLGAGVATGATLLGGVPAAAAAQGDESPLGVATVQGPDSLDQGTLVQALPARNPAYQYRALAWHRLLSSLGGRRVRSVRCVAGASLGAAGGCSAANLSSAAVCPRSATFAAEILLTEP